MRLLGGLTLCALLGAFLGALPVGAAPQVPALAPAAVTATVAGLRSARGKVLACLTARPATFPDCAKDPQAKVLTVAAAASVELDFGAIAPGRYAISLFHDENGNGKLDTRLMIPREGYGFSRDAPVRMGPPSFRSAAFELAGSERHETIRMRYLF